MGCVYRQHRGRGTPTFNQRSRAPGSRFARPWTSLHGPVGRSAGRPGSWSCSVRHGRLVGHTSLLWGAEAGVPLLPSPWRAHGVTITRLRVASSPRVWRRVRARPPESFLKRTRKGGFGVLPGRGHSLPGPASTPRPRVPLHVPLPSLPASPAPLLLLSLPAPSLHPSPCSSLPPPPCPHVPPPLTPRKTIVCSPSRPNGVGTEACWVVSQNPENSFCSETVLLIKIMTVTW